MNLREQEYICMIAKCGSITKAARKLNITQSALSLFVRNLEQRLGVTLFERYKKEIVLTGAGELYVDTAQQILALGEEFELKLQEYLAEGKGRIRFGINSKRSPFIVPELLLKMREVCPKVDIVVKETDTRHLTSMMQAKELDCIFSYEKMTEHTMVSELVSSDRLGLIINGENPNLAYAYYDEERGGMCIDINHLRDETFLVYENDESRYEFDSITAEAGFKPYIQEYYNVDTMLGLVEGGYGIMYMNETYIHLFQQGEKERLRFLLTGRKSGTVDIYFSYYKHLLQYAYGRKFVEVMKEICSNISKINDKHKNN